MAQQATITVFDGAPTPVAHTFIGIGVKSVDGETIATWREVGATTPYAAQASIVMKLKRLSSGIIRTSCRIEVPVMEIPASAGNPEGYAAAPKVAYINTEETIGYYHERSTIVERRLARMLTTNVSNSISTTVTPVNTGPFPELFDMLVMPT